MQYVGGMGSVAKPCKASSSYHHVTVPVRHHHPGEAHEHGGSLPSVTKTVLCPDPGHFLQKRESRVTIPHCLAMPKERCCSMTNPVRPEMTSVKEFQK